MKIGQQPDITPAAGQATQSAASKVAQAATPVPKNDRKAAPGVGVTVSAQARALEQADNSAEVDSEKVTAVRQAIEQKTYTVNAETIADKLLANAREMLDATRR
ncbi:MAG: flagellar biosynthesis anti-sigma factor FlgM [Rhodoferax sp.]|jgi:negative regulator of flagellin synthesis FlgM|nr:flagellar biosynthesis anti-sigma factor FlgM [Rhodoferax sp.]